MPEIPFSQITETPQVQEGVKMDNATAIKEAGREHDNLAEDFAKVLGDRGYVKQYLNKISEIKNQTEAHKEKLFYANLKEDIENEKQEGISENLNPEQTHNQKIIPFLDTAYSDWAKANNITVTREKLQNWEQQKQSYVFESQANVQEYISSENIQSGSDAASVTFDAHERGIGVDLDASATKALAIIYNIKELEWDEKPEEANKLFYNKFWEEMQLATDERDIQKLLEKAERFHSEGLKFEDADWKLSKENINKLRNHANTAINRIDRENNTPLYKEILGEIKEDNVDAFDIAFETIDGEQVPLKDENGNIIYKDERMNLLPPEYQARLIALHNAKNKEARDRAVYLSEQLALQIQSDPDLQEDYNIIGLTALNDLVNEYVSGNLTTDRLDELHEEILTELTQNEPTISATGEWTGVSKTPLYPYELQRAIIDAVLSKKGSHKSTDRVGNTDAQLTFSVWGEFNRRFKEHHQYTGDEEYMKELVRSYRTLEAVLDQVLNKKFNPEEDYYFKDYADAFQKQQNKKLWDNPNRVVKIITDKIFNTLDTILYENYVRTEQLNFSPDTPTEENTQVNRQVDTNEKQIYQAGGERYRATASQKRFPKE